MCFRMERTFQTLRILRWEAFKKFLAYGAHCIKRFVLFENGEREFIFIAIKCQGIR
jgi:hypothetical protein